MGSYFDWRKDMSCMLNAFRCFIPKVPKEQINEIKEHSDGKEKLSVDYDHFGASTANLNLQTFASSIPHLEIAVKKVATENKRGNLVHRNWQNPVKKNIRRDYCPFSDVRSKNNDQFKKYDCNPEDPHKLVIVGSGPYVPSSAADGCPVTRLKETLNNLKPAMVVAIGIPDDAFVKYTENDEVFLDPALDGIYKQIVKTEKEIIACLNIRNWPITGELQSETINNVKFLGEFNGLVEANAPLFIHCRAGFGRSGALAFAITLCRLLRDDPDNFSLQKRDIVNRIVVVWNFMNKERPCVQSLVQFDILNLVDAWANTYLQQARPRMDKPYKFQLYRSH